VSVELRSVLRFVPQPDRGRCHGSVDELVVDTKAVEGAELRKVIAGVVEHAVLEVAPVARREVGVL
jgi:hypothetical protein